MSRSSEYSYELVAAMRQNLFNERVRNTTETFYQRYLAQYEEMLQKGFEDYIPSEMGRLKSDLDEIRNLLITNPAEARDLSMDVGSYISSMFVLGRTAIKEFELQDKLRRQKLAEEMKANKSEALKYFFSAIQKIKDPIIRDFAKDEIEKLKVIISEKEGVSSTSFQFLKDSIDKQVSSIISTASKSAVEWKARRMIDKAEEVQLEQLNNIEKDLQSENIEDKKRVDDFLAKISEMRQSVKNGNIDKNDFSTKIKNIIVQTDDTVISESTRREAVKAIIKSLRTQEFLVEKPQIVEGKNGNYVKIIARKPSGKCAECRIDLSGKIKYKFDQYEGMSCLKDIEKFNVDLNEIYSIKLSEERILWENPIRISKDSRPIDGSQTRRNG